MARKGNPISVRLDLNHSSDSSWFNAKLMGAGAATIALAGAAVGIGNVFSSLIHSVARNPSLAKQLFPPEGMDKFTYFTPFFWSCLFLFTFYIAAFWCLNNFEIQICSYLLSRKLVLTFLKIGKRFILFFFFLRLSIQIASAISTRIRGDFFALHFREGLPDLNMPAPPLSDAELMEESEANAEACKKLVDDIVHKAKEMAQTYGIDESKMDNIEDAVRYLCDVDDIDEEFRIPHLKDFLNDLEKNETWVKIDQECKRWGGRGL